MELYKFINKTRGTTLGDKVRIADSFFARAKGLLGTDSLPDGEGLLIKPCSSIHMFGMRYAIDAVFVDKQMLVVAIIDSIEPGKASKLYGKAHSCLELPAGKAKATSTAVGDQIEYTPL